MFRAHVHGKGMTTFIEPKDLDLKEEAKRFMEATRRFYSVVMAHTEKSQKEDR
jgi:hypothetical protein